MSLYLQRGPSATVRCASPLYVGDLWRRVRRLWSAPAIEAPVAPAPPGVGMAPLPRHCMACGEPLATEHAKFRMPGCVHPAAFDRDCYVRGLESTGGASCPMPGCTNKLCADDLLAEGIKGPWVDALSEAIVARWRATQTLWCGCSTDGCPNGRLLKPDSRCDFDCDCCGAHSVLSTKPTKYAHLDESGQNFVRMLLTNVLQVRAANGASPFASFCGMVRECYHCGVPTEHGGGCAHMKCRACHRKWDFVSGDRRVHVVRRCSQMYVPRTSLLVDLGFYSGLKPGQSYPPHVIGRTLLASIAQIETKRVQTTAASEQPRAMPAQRGDG